MFKKIICSVLTLAAAVCIFSSCSKDSKITVTDGMGKEYTVERDENGFIKTDEKGKMIIYVEDKNDSSEKTKQEAVDFPYFVTDGKSAECSDFRIDIPEGWTANGNQTLKLLHEESKADISFTLRTSDSVADCVSQIKDIYKDWLPVWEEKEVDLGYAKAKSLTSVKLLANTTKTFYVFSNKDKTYVVQTTFYAKKNEKVDFVKMLQSISFK